MGTGDVIAVTLALVALGLKRHGIGSVGFLQQGIADVALAFQDIADGGIEPADFSIFAGNAIGIQLICNLLHALTGEVACKYPAHHRGFLGIGNQRIVCKVVSVGSTAASETAVLHPPGVAPAHIVGDGGGFLLSDGAEGSDHHLIVHIRCFEAIFLKFHLDAEGFQLPDGGETVVDVSCKPGNGLYKDAVDFAFPAVGKHPLEFLPLVRPCSGDALIGVNVHQLPFVISGNQGGVMLHLHGKRIQLVCRIAADSGVGTDTQLGRGIAVNGVYRLNNLYLRHGGTSFGFREFMCDSSFRVSSIPLRY